MVGQIFGEAKMLVKFKLQGGPYIGELIWRAISRRSKFWRGQISGKLKFLEGQKFEEVKILGRIKFQGVQILNFADVLIL